MEDGNLLTALTNSGLAGMLFYMWFMQSRKETALQNVIKEQVEDKKIMRQEREEFIRIIREQSTLFGRIEQILAKLKR